MTKAKEAYPDSSSAWPSGQGVKSAQHRDMRVLLHPPGPERDKVTDLIGARLPGSCAFHCPHLLTGQIGTLTRPGAGNAAVTYRRMLLNDVDAVRGSFVSRLGPLRTCAVALQLCAFQGKVVKNCVFSVLAGDPLCEASLPNDLISGANLVDSECY